MYNNSPSRGLETHYYDNGDQITVQETMSTTEVSRVVTFVLLGSFVVIIEWCKYLWM